MALPVSIILPSLDANRLMLTRYTGNTFCWSASNGAPATGDCAVIADALLYESQNTGVLFSVSAYGVSAS